ncbi:hypothetical protein THAOC_21491 [Thalassiosira oceanica]|uniref:nucleoside-diphosphate kinase n=2 Tax=Thalassiosira oceanica TaxID=159749 RepID=K0RZA1_THAOC|nr:hypothetical protein THAOC_21491 [Thalassiosira oceanica]|eukprot:EJK58385.1 hypothetical protein THAOC_21491 [Thalassiosira oceanica]
MIKPDGVQRGLVGEIIKRFEQKGYKLIAMKLTAPGAAHMETHYEDLKTKKFFPGLISYMTSGPVCAMVWEGGNVVLEGRKMLGATMPAESACGTIRGDFCIEVSKYPFSLITDAKQSGGTSVTEATASSPLRRRSRTGSPRVCAHTSPVSGPGFTSRWKT